MASKSLFLARAGLVASAYAAASLTANATAFSHLDYITVQATGLTPNANIWMGIFYPANATVTYRAPLVYPATAPVSLML